LSLPAQSLPNAPACSRQVSARLQRCSGLPVDNLDFPPDISLMTEAAERHQEIETDYTSRIQIVSTWNAVPGMITRLAAKTVMHPAVADRPSAGHRECEVDSLENWTTVGRRNRREV